MFQLDDNSSEIEIDYDGKVFLDVVSKHGHTKGYIDTYNQALRRIADLIDGTEIIINSLKVLFKNTTYTVPDRLPFYYRENGETYGVLLTTTVYNDQTEIKLNLGKIPIMTGSDYDIVNYAEALDQGECPDDPKSYFIFEGNELVFNGQENLAVNKLINYAIGDSSISSNNIVSITTESKHGKTSMITVYADKDNIVRFNSFRDFAENTRGSNNLNVFIIFWIFEKKVNVEDLLEYTRPEWRTKVETYLMATYEDFIRLDNINILEKIHSINEKKVEARVDMSKLPEDVRSIYVAIYKKHISEGLYSHIATSNTDQKLALLSLQTIRCIESLLTLRPKTDRDAYRNKRIKTPGPAIFHLFGLYWEMSMKQIREDEYRSPSALMTAVSSILQSTNIEDHLTSSFKKVWGLKGQRNMKNTKPFEIYKGNYYVSRHKHPNKLIRVRNARSQNFSIRAIQADQTGYVDAFETPESAKNGLNNTKAISSRISLFVDDDIIISMLKEANVQDEPIFLPDIYQTLEDYNTFIMVSGIIIGICKGHDTHKLLRKHKRFGALPKDIGIYYEPNHLIIVSTDPGRLIRPLYTVNKDTGKLIVDELSDQFTNSTDSNELMAHGAIQFLDPMESEEIVICESPFVFRKLQNQINELQNNIELYTKYLNNPENTYHLHLDNPLVIVEHKIYEAHINNLNEQYTDTLKELRSIRDGYLSDMDTLISSDGDNIDFGDKYKALLGDIERLDIKILGTGGKLNDLIANSNSGLNTKYISKVIYDLRVELLRLQREQQYDYCEIDPVSQFGVSMSLIPRANHNPGPRNVFQSKMYNQAQGHYNSAARTKFEITKSLVFGHRPIIETETARLFGMPHHTQGTTVILGIMTAGGWNIEDALVFNLAAVQRGLGLSIDTRIIKENIDLPIKEVGGADIELLFIVPEEIRTKSIKTRGIDIYRHLDERGIVKPGAVLRVGDCIRTVFKVTDTENRKYTDISSYVRKSKVGTVVKLIYNKDRPDKHLLVIEVAVILMPQLGDKFSPLHAQKGVMGQLRRHEDMPYSMEGGIVPSILINPHAIPSRMTVSMLIEMLVSKVGALTDTRINMTSFRPFDAEPYENILLDHGYRSDGKETLINGETGHPFEVDIYVAPCYYSRLLHDVEDKYQMRSEGAYKMINHQPVTGRDYDGAMRWGEMERDTLIGHGATGMLKEVYKLNSNPFDIYACKRCTPNTRVVKTTGGNWFCPTCDDSPDLIVSSSTYAQEMLRNYSAGFGTLMEYDYELI